jgi:hypothetical protein
MCADAGKNPPGMVFFTDKIVTLQVSNLNSNDKTNIDNE